MLTILWTSGVLSSDGAFNDEVQYVICPPDATQKTKMEEARKQGKIHGTLCFAHLLHSSNYSDVVHALNIQHTPQVCLHSRVLTRPFPKGTVPFGSSIVPFGSATKEKQHALWLHLKTNIFLTATWT